MTAPRITPMGLSGLLLDAAGERFSDAVQARVHAVSTGLREQEGVTEVVPGMNNLLVEFAPESMPARAVRDLLLSLWETAAPEASAGKTVEIPVHYGGPEAEDLAMWAKHSGMTMEEVIRTHAEGSYSVAAIGAMPGFGYLSGLDPRLAIPRRSVPRTVVPEGAVIVGGAQAAVMPVTAPSGWHIIGHTEVRLFDPRAKDPCLLSPGDRVRFVIAGICQ